MTGQLKVIVAQTIAVLAVLAAAAHEFLGTPASWSPFLFDQAIALLISAIPGVVVGTAIKSIFRSLPPAVIAGMTAALLAYSKLTGG